LIYHEKVKTTKVYIRDCSSISPYALAFFGGKLSIERKGNIKMDHGIVIYFIQNFLFIHFVEIGWIRFKCEPKVSTSIEATRIAFDELLQMKIENPELDVSQTDLVKEIVRLVTRNATSAR
jgi:ATP-dependent RNA helicase DHX57